MSKTYKTKVHLRKYTLYGIFAFVVITTIITSLCLTVLFNIKEIEVVGNNYYDDKLVIAAGNFRMGDNLFTSNIAESQEDIKDTFPYFKDVKITRKLPNKLIINIEEAKITFVAKELNDKYTFLSKEGRIMKQNVPYLPSGFIVTYGLDLENSKLGENISSGDKLRFDLISRIYEYYPMLTEIDISSITNIKFTVNDKLKIKFGDESNFDQKIQMINAVINSNGPNIEGIIDASNPKEVHFR